MLDRPRARATRFLALWLLRLGLTLSVAACGPNLPPLPEYNAAEYRLGVGDQIRVITYGEDQLTRDFRVDDQGRVAMPLLGSVGAAGLTTQELETALARQLREKNFIRNPSVSVEVLAYRPIFVLGEVGKPGQYPFQPRMTALTAVAVAGGFTYRAIQDRVGVVRSNNGRSVEGLATPNTFLAPGDVVRVYERWF